MHDHHCHQTWSTSTSSTTTTTSTQSISRPRQFSLFVEAATILHAMNKDSSSMTCFPKLYTIPRQAPWPLHLQGVKLNTAQVRMHYKNNNLHPDTKRALEAINFVFDVNQVKWEQKIAALRLYKQLHGGDLCVPQDFRIPTDDSRWPRDLWGMRLGLAVRSIRQKTPPTSDRFRQLSAMGFVWNVLDMGWETKRVALATYKHLYGDLLVAYNFTVPSQDNQWPRDTWNLKLGHAVHNIRQNGRDMSSDRLDQLAALGFVWDHLESTWDVKVTALQFYKLVHGHTAVPYGFIVPGQGAEPSWPRETWGMKLGHAVHNMRQSVDDMPAARRMMLNSLGFHWQSAPLTWDVKLRALQVYRDLHGHLNIPPDFRVPATSDAQPWPNKCWHVRLADVSDELRLRADAMHETQVAALNDLGFQWQKPTAVVDVVVEQHDEDVCGVESISICDGFPLLKRRRVEARAQVVMSVVSL
ncbi:hypothetical protein H257_10261 [Aphanomyces astaci]|uniref:Helicase-associated domain-containing protein n=1 Tax=Aphanomyces astaci TaxID=112090 RepID=W4G7Z3_APHAT|nr:hypothetical protein H257_10261 [Aphanomyces astaci]ETV75416.1 hypothetical protein H257_10261 [Aphanomyces astaci]RQM27827.1 hypothetical protein B5M09_005673 [Aphanomyces astaci]|eukprot:XP_009835050.1 hypothetical protein H257_10261 [Aphanomyces astaci]